MRDVTRSSLSWGQCWLGKPEMTKFRVSFKGGRNNPTFSRNAITFLILTMLILRTIFTQPFHGPVLSLHNVHNSVLSVKDTSGNRVVQVLTLKNAGRQYKEVNI